MTRTAVTFVTLALLAALPPAAAVAQSAAVEEALNAGAVGEQSDGYLGFPKPPSAALKAQVDAINIKRRQGYTQVAQARNVPIEAFAASVGCKALAGIRPGRAYSTAPGAWAVKGAAPVDLPPQCGG